MTENETQSRGKSILELGPILRSMRRSKVRFGLIVLEVALTLAVVANCITMIVDAKKQMARPSGFDDENIISVRSIPFDPAFKEIGYLDNSLKADMGAIRATPGVRAATVTYFLPWQGGGSSGMFKAVGPKGEMLRSQIYSVDDGFLDALGTHLVEGRAFTREDVERDTRRLSDLSPNRERGPDGKPRDKFLQDILITRAYARLVFGDNTPLLGKLLEDEDGDQYRIIGVVDPFYNPYGWPIHDYAIFYASYSRSFQGVSFLVRTDPGMRAEAMKNIEATLLASNSGRNVQLRPLVEVKAGYFTNQRAVEILMSIIVVLLVVVTSLGIVGLTSFTVAERTRTIGTRRALGASKADILKHFLLENWLVTTMGLALGVVLTYALNMGLVSSVSTAKMSWLLPAGGVVLLWLAGLGATLVPALRAARISPAIATRNV